MNLLGKNLILLALMFAACAAAAVLRPTIKLAEQRPETNLEQLVPKQFADWRALEQADTQIINPQQTELIKKLYTQTLARTYVNVQGRIVMLSIAYGANQSDEVALHYPEVCYPAQGFQVYSNDRAVLATMSGDIRVRRLVTRLGERNEHVIYWSVLGDKAVQGGIETKLEQLKYGFKGQIPDGLLFRVSALNSDSAQAFALSESFIAQLVATLPPSARLRLAGLGADI